METDRELEQKNGSGRMVYFFAMFCVFNIAANCVHPVTPTLIQRLNLSDYMFGVAFASMMFCQFLFSPFWGKLNNYVSGRKIILVAGMIYAAAQVLFGLAKTEPEFVLARLLAGVGCSGTYLCFLTYIINRSPSSKRGRNLAVYATLTSVSSAAGFLIGGLVGEIDIYLSVWMQVIVLVISSVLLCAGMRDDAKGSLKDIRPSELVRSANPFSAFIQMGKFMTPLMAVLFFYYGMATLGFIAFDQCFNYYIRDQFGFTSAYNGVIKAALGVISLAANSTICMWILKKKDTSRYMVPVLLICCVSMLGVVLLDSIVPFVLVNILFFAFYYISLPLAQDMCAELGKDKDSNLVMASFNSIKSFGSIFGALFAGFIYELNPKLPFTFGFAAFAIATALALLYRKMEKRR